MSAQYIPPPSLPLSGGTMTGQIKGADGSASTPGYAFSSDGTMGFFRQAASKIGIALGGAEKFRLGLNSQSTSRFAFGGTIDDTISAASSFICINTGSNSSNFNILGELTVNHSLQRYSADVSPVQVVLIKGRGTVASPAVPVLGDTLGNILFNGQNVSTGAQTATTGVRLNATLTETGTVSSTAMGSHLLISACPIGSGTLTEVARIGATNGLSMFGANPVIDQNRLHVFRAYTVATLPTGVNAYSKAFVTDATLTIITGIGLAPTGGGGNKVPVYTVDGTNWLIG